MPKVQPKQADPANQVESLNQSEGRDSCCRRWFYNPICSCMSTILSPIKSVLTLLCSSCIKCYSSLCGRAAPPGVVHICKANPSYRQFIEFAEEHEIEPLGHEKSWMENINALHAAYQNLYCTHHIVDIPTFALAVIERPSNKHPGRTYKFLAILSRGGAHQVIQQVEPKPYGKVEELSSAEARQSNYTHYVRFHQL